MTDERVALWLIAVGAFEILALFVFSVFMIGGNALKLHRVLKTGLILLSLGLVVQIVRSVHYLNYGMYPVDRYVPAWALKDVGGSLILYYFAFIAPKEGMPHGS